MQPSQPAQPKNVETKPSILSGITRRALMRNTTAVAAGAAAASSLGFPSGVYAQSDGTIRVGLVGCGGRGSGAAVNALRGDPNAKLVAVADAFKDKAEASLKNLKMAEDVGKRVEVTPDAVFDGFDGYKKVIQASDVVILATPPHFRPMQLRAAVEAGKHVFCEKPVAVDAPGVHHVMESAKMAQAKNLSLVSGLCYRYDEAKQELVKKIHDGEIGDITYLQSSFMSGGLWSNARQPGWSDMEWQVRNWLYFVWLSGDHIVEQAIHGIDKMLWVMKDVPPAKALATGGRIQRVQPQYGNVYDHFTTQFEWENGVRCTFNCRQLVGCDTDVSDWAFGTKGTADIMNHRITEGGKQKWKRRKPGPNMYDAEHVALFKSIRNNQPINNGDYMCKATMMAIMGRMSAYTGKTVKWDEAWNSKEDLTPKGGYQWGDLEVAPVAVPGQTKIA